MQRDNAGIAKSTHTAEIDIGKMLLERIYNY